MVVQSDFRTDTSRLSLAAGCRFLEHNYILMFEDVVSSGECAISPQVGPPSLSSFIASDILHDDGLKHIACPLHTSHAVESKRDQLPLGVFVADDEHSEPPRFQQSESTNCDRLEEFQEFVQVSAVRKTRWAVGEMDDVVVRWVQHQQLGVVRSHFGKNCVHLLSSTKPSRIPSQQVDSVIEYLRRDLGAHILNELWLEFNPNQATT